MKKLASALLHAALLTLAASAARAVPYVTTYSGTVAYSTMPGVADGSGYVVSVVFDNGGSTVLNQSWSPDDITCVMWRTDQGTVVYAQPILQGNSLISGSGNADTDGTGWLTQMFTAIVTPTGVPPASYTATSPIAGNVTWYANGGNHVFRYDGGSGPAEFSDASGGVRMQLQFWSPPQQFTGTCAAPPAPPTPTPVPTLGQGALALLGAAMASLAAWRRRRGM